MKIKSNTLLNILNCIYKDCNRETFSNKIIVAKTELINGRWIFTKNSEALEVYENPDESYYDVFMSVFHIYFIKALDNTNTPDKLIEETNKPVKYIKLKDLNNPKLDYEKYKYYIK